MKDGVKKKSVVTLLVWIVMLALPCTGAAAREFRVAVTQFDARPGDDVSFIQSALLTLLSARISQPDRITVIDHAALLKYLPGTEKTSTLQDKLGAAKKAHADFLLTGRIVKQDKSINLDARLMHITGGGGQTPVDAQAISIDRLIPEVNAFAHKVRQIIGGYPQPPDPPVRLVKQQPQQRRQKAIADDIPEDMPYPPMPEKKQSDRFKLNEREEEKVRESTIDDTAE